MKRNLLSVLLVLLGIICAGSFIFGVMGTVPETWSTAAVAVYHGGLIGLFFASCKSIKRVVRKLKYLDQLERNRHRLPDNVERYLQKLYNDENDY
jgi:hypothetical protein